MDIPELLHVLPTDVCPDAAVGLGIRAVELYRAPWRQDWAALSPDG